MISSKRLLTVAKRDPVRVEKIERLRWEERNRGKSFNRSKPPKKPGWIGILIAMFDQILTFLNELVKKGAPHVQDKSLEEILLSIKKSFEEMMQEDMSQNVQFLKNLSILWQKILEATIQTNTPMTQGTIQFIKEIDNQPREEEHTLGYYLEEFAGQKWLPFPYMELIQKIHHNHLMDPTSSLLTKWVKMIEEILNTR